MQLEDSVGFGINLLGVAASAAAPLQPHTTHPLGLRSASRVIARKRRPLTATHSAQRGSASWSGSHHLPGFDPSTCPKDPPRRGCSIDHSTSLAPHLSHGRTVSRLRRPLHRPALRAGRTPLAPCAQPTRPLALEPQMHHRWCRLANAQGGPGPGLKPLGWELAQSILPPLPDL